MNNSSGSAMLNAIRLLLWLSTVCLFVNGLAAQDLGLLGNEGFAAPALASFAPAPAPWAAAPSPFSLDAHPPADDYPSTTVRGGQRLQLRVHAYRNFQPHIYPGMLHRCQRNLRIQNSAHFAVGYSRAVALSMLCLMLWITTGLSTPFAPCCCTMMPSPILEAISLCSQAIACRAS